MAWPREYLLTIKAEIANDPLALGYAGKTDQQQANLLNAAAGAVTRMPITTKAMFDNINSATIQAVWDAADSPAAAPTPSVAGRQAAIAFRAYMLGGQSIDVAPGTAGRTVLASLVTAALVTSAQVIAAVTAAETQPAKRREQIGVSGIVQDLTAQDVADAKAAV